MPVCLLIFGWRKILSGALGFNSIPWSVQILSRTSGSYQVPDYQVFGFSDSVRVVRLSRCRPGSSRNAFSTLRLRQHDRYLADNMKMSRKGTHYIKATSHYLNQWRHSFLTYKCVARPQWVKYMYICYRDPGTPCLWMWGFVRLCISVHMCHCVMTETKSLNFLVWIRDEKVENYTERGLTGDRKNHGGPFQLRSHTNNNVLSP